MLERMRARPTLADIRWVEIAALLGVLGVEVVERTGSRVLLRKDDHRIVVHRPHPRPEARRDTVRNIVDFVSWIGGDE